jgi:hypothetical protein
MNLEDYLHKSKQVQFRGGFSYWNNELYTTHGRRFKGGIGILVSQK